MASNRAESGGPASPRAVPRGHPDYPDGLSDLGDAPETVYVRGRVPARGAAVAIVGARAATAYGESIAGRLAHDLAALGYAVVSGLARGIDAAAHRAALEGGGTTVAVLPGGLDAITPRHHAALAEAIAARGALLSDWPGGPPAARGMFVRRNRLIAALASAVVVVEAGETSGALSTAAAARRLGRPLLAVPGDVDRPGSQGCLALLRAGARLCAGAGDVLAALPEAARPADARLLNALGAAPSSAEEIAARAELPLGQALATLLRLEWAGAAASCPGGRWRRAAGATS